MNGTDQRQRPILAEQVKLLYAQANPGIVASVINASILVAVLHQVVPQSWLFAWFAAILLVTAGRYLLVRHFNAVATAASDPRRWANRYTLGAGLAGLCWGVAGTLLFPTDSVVHQMLLMLVLAGMSAGAMPFLSAVPGTYLAFLVPILVPLSAWLYMQSVVAYQYMALLVLVYLGVLIITARRNRDTIEQSLRLRFENAGLIGTLAASKDQLESTSDRLQLEVLERAEADRQLRESHEFLQRIMDSTTNAIYVLDLEGRFMRGNQALALFTGYKLDELTGKPFAMFFAKDVLPQISREFLRVASRGRIVRQFVADFRRRNGQWRTISMNGAPLREGDRIVGVVGTAEDITERSRVERLKSEFVSTVSHELRTPLTSIRGSLGLMRGGATGELPEKAAELTDIAYKNTVRLVDLVNDLLDIQRLEAGEVQFDLAIHDLDALVRHAVEINEGFAKEHDVELTFSNSAGAVDVSADKGRLEQILTNLISNAAKFSPAGTNVEIGIERLPNGVRTYVRDHGPGIPDEFRERIFARFSQADASSTREKGGTGLGLAIAKQLVERMDGHISFDSTPGEGATFFVDLPEWRESNAAV